MEPQFDRKVVNIKTMNNIIKNKELEKTIRFEIYDAKRICKIERINKMLKDCGEKELTKKEISQIPLISEY